MFQRHFLLRDNKKTELLLKFIVAWERVQHVFRNSPYIQCVIAALFSCCFVTYWELLSSNVLSLPFSPLNEWAFRCACVQDLKVYKQEGSHMTRLLWNRYDQNTLLSCLRVRNGICQRVMDNNIQHTETWSTQWSFENVCRCIIR